MEKKVKKYGKIVCIRMQDTLVEAIAAAVTCGNAKTPSAYIKDAIMKKLAEDEMVLR